MNKGILLTGIIFPLAFAGCGSLTHKKDEASVAKVKRIAVVAFTATLPSAAKLSLDVGSGKLGAEAGGSIIPQNDPNVDAMFDELNKSFEKNLNWQVMPSASMSANASYKKAFEKTMTGWQNKMPAGAGQRQFIVKNIMDYDGPRILGMAGRDALMRDLNVDAIAVAQVYVSLAGTTVMGIGSRHPQSRLSFMIYRPGEEAPIWFEGAVDGDEQESVGKTAYIDEAKLSNLALKSAKTAFAKIGTTVQ